MNTSNIIFFIILIITFVHHITGSIIGSFFTAYIFDNNDDYSNYKYDYLYHTSFTGYINYAILKIKTKVLDTKVLDTIINFTDEPTTVKINFTDEPSNSLTSLLPLTVMSILTLLFAIILLITYIFYKNIYIKKFIYILLGLCLLFTCIILILVPSYIIKNATQSKCSSIKIMSNFDDNNRYNCSNSLNYAYVTNIITSFLVICIFIYLRYYGFKTL